MSPVRVASNQFATNPNAHKSIVPIIRNNIRIPPLLSAIAEKYVRYFYAVIHLRRKALSSPAARVPRAIATKYALYRAAIVRSDILVGPLFLRGSPSKRTFEIDGLGATSGTSANDGCPAESFLPVIWVDVLTRRPARGQQSSPHSAYDQKQFISFLPIWSPRCRVSLYFGYCHLYLLQSPL
jgi:hypothetical protein